MYTAYFIVFNSKVALRWINSYDNDVNHHRQQTIKSFCVALRCHALHPGLLWQVKTNFQYFPSNEQHIQ